MIYWANGSEPDEDDNLPPIPEDSPGEITTTHTMEMHGETAILIPSNITVTGIEQMIEIVHSLPATQKKKEDSHTYRASIKINNVPIIIYYFDLAHPSSLERKNFILDMTKSILEDTNVGNKAIIIGTPLL